METRIATWLTVTACVLLFTACGGSGTEIPAPVFPDVTDLTDADLDAADIPALPQVASSVSAARSAAAVTGCERLVSVQADEPVNDKNLIGTTYGGDGQSTYTTSGVAE